MPSIDPLAWFARHLLLWALGNQYPWVDPITEDPRTFASIERAVRTRQQEPPLPDLDKLARNVLDARDSRTRTIAVGALVAHYKTELRIARVTAYVLGHAFRDIRADMRTRPKRGEVGCLF